jgi:integrase
MKLTERSVRDLVGPVGQLTKSGKPMRDALVFADAPQGLAVRVDANAGPDELAGKSFIVQYRINGVRRRVPLGACSAVSVADAIKAAKAVLGDVAKGRDPFAERKEAKQAVERDAYTFEALICDWTELHLKSRRDSYANSAPRVLRRVFKALLGLPAAKVDADRILRVHDQLAPTTPMTAARAVSYGSACFGWAVKRRRLKENPFRELPTAEPVQRERVLEDEELRAIWRATEGPGVFNSIVRMLALTGQRREEVAGMIWRELSVDGATWTLPGARAKNDKTHIVPLSKQAQGIIAAQPRSNASTLVFPGVRGNNTYNGWARAKTALDQASKVEGWVLHDLRRTVATNLQRLGVRLEVTESVLNHVGGSRGGIVGVYQRHDWAAEKSAALQSWADRLDMIVANQIDEAVNVVTLRAP